MKKSFTKALALILAVLTLCSGFATGAFAKAKPLSISIDVDHTSKSVSYEANLDEDAAADLYYSWSEISVSITPAPSASNSKIVSSYDTDYENGLFFNLVPGTTYKVTATVIFNEGEDDEETETVYEEFTLKKQQTKPTSISYDKTSTTITVDTSSTLEYKLDDGEWVDATSGYTFDDLTPETKYTLSVRVKETTTMLASEAFTKTVTTMKEGSTIPGETPVLSNVTNTSIKLVEVDDYEYAYCKTQNGTYTWQTSNSFTGLTSNTTYYFKQRLAAEENQEENASSVVVSYKTNKESGFDGISKKDDSKLTLTSNESADTTAYANSKSCSFTVTAQAPAISRSRQVGDTMLVPYSYEVYYKSALQTSGYFTASDSKLDNAASTTYTGAASFSTASAKYTITVTYKVYRYWFDEEEYAATGEQNNKWVEYTDYVDTVNKTANGIVKKDFTINTVKEVSIWSKVLSFFTNTVPNYITEYIPKITKVFTYLYNLFKDKT